MVGPRNPVILPLGTVVPEIEVSKNEVEWESTVASIRYIAPENKGC